MIALIVLSYPCDVKAVNDNYALVPAIRKIQENGSLVVGIPPFNTKPFYYYDKPDGQLLGYDVELATRLAERLGVKVVFDQDSKSFDDLVRRSGSGEVDIAIGKLGTTYSRLYNSNPQTYLEFNQALLINRQSLSSIGKDNDKDLGKKIRNSKIRIGAIANSAYTTYASYYFTNADVVAFDDWKSTIHALTDRNVDAIYRDINEIKMVVMDNPKLNVDYATINIVDGVDKKSIYIGQDLSGLGPFVEHFISDEFGILNSKDIMDRYSNLLAKGDLRK